MRATKQPDEVLTFTYDFGDRLGSATIASAEPATSSPRGPGPNLTSAGQAIDGSCVLVSWEGGEAGEDYLTTVRVTVSTGDRIEIDGVVAVRAGGFGAEPVSLALAKEQCRVLDDSEDALFETYIPAAREWVESYTGLTLTKRTVTQAFDYFDGDLRLHAWPVASPAGLAVRYADQDGEPQLVDDARLIPSRRPARVAPAFGGSWPRCYYGSVEVTVLAGFEPGKAPEKLVQAMLLLIAHWYNVREAVMVGTVASEVPFAVEALCRPHRLMTFA